MGALTRGNTTRLLSLGPVLAGLALVAGAAVVMRRTYGGDPTIYLPYARNLADGRLFQYNPGEFSSGSTSPLWAVLLSIPYLLGAGFKGAKAFAALWTAAAYLLSFAAARRVTGSNVAAGIAALWVVTALTLTGLLIFESSLAVALVAGSLWLTARVAERQAEGRSLDARALAPLVLLWAALPLARPEAAVLVPIQAAAVLLAGTRRRRELALTIGAMAVAALPAAGYFGYSLVEFGVASMSTEGRSLALRETSTERLGPLYLSNDALEYLFSSPAVFAFVPALAGLVIMARRPIARAVALHALAGIGAYVFLVSFVSPGSFDTSRYLLPIAPFLVVGVAGALRAVSGTRVAVPAFLVAAALLGIPAADMLFDDARTLARGQFTFDNITQREAAERVNALAAPGDEVLAFEVQSRYFLRDDVDVLSLDGITDGRAFEYIERKDVAGFLRRYRPRFWIADTSTDIDPRRPGTALRPYLEDSVLTAAVKRARANPDLGRTSVAGIEFRLMALRPKLPHTSGAWTMVFELRYS